MSHLESKHGIGQETASQLCPLCLDQISGGRDIISLHFARHLEEIALAVLPTSAESDSESDESNSETQESATIRSEQSNTLKRQFYKRSDEEQSPRRQEGILRIYGCTFSGCSSTFTRRRAWERHEDNSHVQNEGFRCKMFSLDGGFTYPACGAFYSSSTEFKVHLESRHGLGDPEAVRKEIDESRLGRDYKEQYWCGFCQVIIKQSRIGAWPMRMSHIAFHFEKEGRSMADWVCVDTNKPKGRFMPSFEQNPLHQAQETTIPEYPGLSFFDTPLQEISAESHTESLSSTRARSGETSNHQCLECGEILKCKSDLKYESIPPCYF